MFSIEQAKIQKGWIEGLEAGNKALTAIHEEMGGVERVEKIMNQSADAIADEQVSYILVVATGKVWEMQSLMGDASRK